MMVPRSLLLHLQKCDSDATSLAGQTEGLDNSCQVKLTIIEQGKHVYTETMQILDVQGDMLGWRSVPCGKCGDCVIYVLVVSPKDGVWGETVVVWGRSEGSPVLGNSGGHHGLHTVNRPCLSGSC